MLTRQIGQQPEVRDRVGIHGGNAHQACELQAVNVPRPREERIHIAWRQPGLLGLFARIDLGQKAQCPVLLLHLRCKGSSELVTVHRLDHIEKGHGLGHLVGLQRADEVEFDIRETLFQGRPFAFGLLHAVFAEDAVTGVEHWEDRRGIVGLGDGHERHLAGPPPGCDTGALNLRTDGKVGLGNRISHLPALMATLAGLGKDW